MIVEYASSLSQMDFYWQVVADYLAYCGPQSDHYLPLFIQRIPLSSEKKASKVLKLCQRHGLNSEGMYMMHFFSTKVIYFFYMSKPEFRSMYYKSCSLAIVFSALCEVLHSIEWFLVGQYLSANRRFYWT